MTDIEPAGVSAYHAHIYYLPDTRGMYQVLFASAEFARVVPWLMLNRRGLQVLVHPDTGDDLADHTRHALWLGDRLPLRLEALQPH